MYSNMSMKISSMPTMVCSAWLTTTSLPCDGGPKYLPCVSPLCTSFVVSCIHSVFQKSSPKTMHILCRTGHKLTNSDTFFKCTLIIFNKILHLPFSIPNARSMHMRLELFTKFQWYSSWINSSLCPLYGANIHGQQGYATSPTRACGDSFHAS